MGSAVLEHDLMEPLPREFDACDVFYSDPPWRNGAPKFDALLGVDPREYSAFQEAAQGLVDSVAPRPVILSMSRGAVVRFTGVSSVLLAKLNGALTAFVGFRIGIPELSGSWAILYWLAERFRCVGDPCCGYGRTGWVFRERGRCFVMSDYDPHCVDVVAEWMRNV